MNPQMRKMTIQAFRTLQRPPSSLKISLECFLSVQLSTGCLKCATTLNIVFVHVQVILDHGGKNKIFIHDDHECIGAMTCQDLLRHLKMKVILLMQLFPSIFKH
jgi:hypothetical protein